MDKRIFNGKRLKNARLFRGLTLTELADHTGISKQSISLYENERNTPEHERVQVLASTLNFPYEFFFQTDACETVTEVTYFRSLASATKMSRTAQSVKLEYVAKTYEVLLNYIDFPAINLPEVSFDGSDDEFDDKCIEDTQQQIESIAQQVRELWGVGDAPIKNLQFFARKKRRASYDTDLIRGITNPTLLAREQLSAIRICILLPSRSGQRPEGRIRFDMAHELGHILLHPWSENLELITKEEF